MITIIAVLFLLTAMSDPSVIVIPVIIAAVLTVAAVPLMVLGLSTDMAFLLAPVAVIGGLFLYCGVSSWIEKWQKNRQKEA